MTRGASNGTDGNAGAMNTKADRIGGTWRENSSARVELDDGRSLIAVRRGGATRLFLNRCPHRGIELDWVPGLFTAIDGHHLQCATHGALFDPDTGLCISGPCSGQSLDRVAIGT